MLILKRRWLTWKIRRKWMEQSIGLILNTQWASVYNVIQSKSSKTLYFNLKLHLTLMYQSCWLIRNTLLFIFELLVIIFTNTRTNWFFKTSMKQFDYTQLNKCDNPINVRKMVSQSLIRMFTLLRRIVKHIFGIKLHHSKDAIFPKKTILAKSMKNIKKIKTVWIIFFDFHLSLMVIYISDMQR